MNRSMGPAAAILDIDGTLVDSNYHHTITWFRACGQHDVTLPLWRIHRHRLQTPLGA